MNVDLFLMLPGFAALAICTVLLVLKIQLGMMVQLVLKVI